MAGKGEYVFQEKGTVNQYGDGATWTRGPLIGKGNFGCVYLATLKHPRSKYTCFPSLMAVKSAQVSVSGTIRKEREVLSILKGCPYIIKCFGEEITNGGNDVMAYNLLLEYASGGTLADRIKKPGCNEYEARVYARSILKGLNRIHDTGYVHRDLKPENILLVGDGGSSDFTAKIGDFGLAKREEKISKKRKILEPYWRGSPMYLSPEAVMDKVQESPCDVWAVGCIVLEMLTGKPAWDGKKAQDILTKIGTEGELPKIPNEISKEARDFIKCCFVRNPMYRPTCELLLTHPFVEDLDDDEQLQEIEDFKYSSSDESVSNQLLYPDEYGSGCGEDPFSYWFEDQVADDLLSDLPQEIEDSEYGSRDDPFSYWFEEVADNMDDELLSDEEKHSGEGDMGSSTWTNQKRDVMRRDFITH